MNLGPDDAERIRRDIVHKHRMGRRARLEALESDGKALRASLTEVMGRVTAFCNQASAMLREIRQEDDTTILIKAIPKDEPKEARVRPFLD